MDDRTMTTTEEVIRLARESGFVLFDNATDEAITRFKRLVDIVRAEENEACAKVCEDEACGGSAFNSASKYMAERIRARRK